jgi:hypothetical protein
MSGRIFDGIKKTLYEETWKERRKRMLPGVQYGILTATVYSITAAVINILFFPDLNLAFDWMNFLGQWLVFTIMLALGGLIVGWFTENYMAIFGGGLVLTVLLFLGNLVGSITRTGSIFFSAQSILTSLPLIGACILLAWAIRAVINRRSQISQQPVAAVRRKMEIQLLVIITMVGLIPGIFSRFGLASEYAIRSLGEGLRTATTDPLAEARFPIESVPELKDHFGQEFVLFPRISRSVSGALDITIRFSDGYTITCLVPTDSDVFLQYCNPGKQLELPQN